MKNKDKYNLNNIEPILRRKNRSDYKPPYRFWEVKIYEDGIHVDTKFLEHGCMSDLMAWLESDD